MSAFIDPAKKPIHESNQIVASPGKNYFYEEYDHLMTFEFANVPLVPTKVFITKVGRMVTLFFDIITAPASAGRNILGTDPTGGYATALPVRFRPPYTLNGAVKGVGYASGGGRGLTALAPNSGSIAIRVNSDGLVSMMWGDVGSTAEGRWPDGDGAVVEGACITYPTTSAYAGDEDP